MKKIIIPIGALLITGWTHAQLSPTENYVYSKTILDYNTSNVATKTSETVQYFDGLGRPKQVVNIKASPLGRDVVTHIEYDGFGRQVKDFLPVPQSQTLNGAIVPTPLAHATQAGIYGQEKIFAEKKLENSPLDRLMEQKQVGTAWNDKPVKFEYDTNTGAEVKKYVTVTIWASGTSSTAISQSVNYPAGQLYKNTLTDEDGNKTIEFKNGKGQVLLIRKVIDASHNADTYYVYNEYNQLALVIPPQASIVSDVNTVVSSLCYIYRYDGRNRLILKKLPGKGYEFMVYDKQDRLIMTQDAVMGASKQWLFTKYDQFGRVAYTGIYTSAEVSGTVGRAAEQALADAKGSNNVMRTTSVGFIVEGRGAYYSNNTTSYPNSITTLLSINYYDTYPVYGFNPTFPTNVLGTPVITDNSTGNSISTKGLPVMSLVRNIEDNNWTSNYTYYDNKGRAIGTHSINHLGGFTRTETELDFAGIAKKIITKHKRLNSDTERIIEENFTYDRQNRLLTHTHKVDNNPIEILTQNKYNELSQLESKKVGGTSPTVPLQTVDYKYNIRGWMTHINDPTNLGNDLFGYKINYNQVEGLETPDALDATLKVKAKYNGNIAEVSWRTLTAQNEPLRRYGYVYDPLNRLRAGFYQGSNPSAKEYFEKMQYDLNGNIMSLQRSANIKSGNTAALIDDLNYQYIGNRLQSVTDIVQNLDGYPGGGNTISYDLNGNMIKHLDKGITSIKYNHLSLPNDFTVNIGNVSASQTTKYIYRSDGTKVRKLFRSGGRGGTKIVDYLDGFQYEEGIFFPSHTLYLSPTSEGYYDYQENRYIYQYKDHLGNVRVSYIRDSQTQTLKILDQNDYYPYGMNHLKYENSFSAGMNYKNYQYNGKELQEMKMYDYGARFYMQDIGRWGVVDPLAENSRRWSPYTYAFNNPISFIDPDGREGKDWFKNSLGNMEFRLDINSQKDLDDKGIKGSYVGETTQVGNLTYAADGNVYDDSASGGGLPVENGKTTDIAEVTMTQKPSAARQAWNFASENIISKPVEGVQFFGYFFYGLGQVPGEMYKQGRMENIHVKMDMTLRGFRNGNWVKTMEYVDGETVMSEQEKFEKMAIPAIEATTFGVGQKLNLVKNGAANAALKMGIKTAAKKSIYKTVEH